MAFRLDIIDIREAAGLTLKDLSKLINPYTVRGFFEGLGEREGISPYVMLLWALISTMSCAFMSNLFLLVAALSFALLVGLWYGRYMDRLLLLSGLSVFLGYSVHLTFFSYPVHAAITSIKLGYVYWMSYVFVPVAMIVVLHRWGEKLVGEMPGNGKASSLAVYSMVPALITGIFRIFLETTIIHYIFLAYSIYVLYLGVKIMFGFNRAMYAFLMLMLTASITGMLLLVLSTMLLGIPTPYY